MNIFTKTSWFGIFVVVLLMSACATVKIPTTLRSQVKQNIRENDVVLNEELISCFLEIAFKSGYSTKHPLLSWNKPVRIKILGQYTPKDSMVVMNVIEDLNAILHSTHLLLVSKEHNIIMFFTGKKGFELNAPKEAWDSAGYNYITWSPMTKYMRAGKILINTSLSPVRSQHVIREEITQILGLNNDSYSYPESIFYQKYSEATNYSSMDIRVLKLWDILKPVTGYKKKAVKELLFDILESEY